MNGKTHVVNTYIQANLTNLTPVPPAFPGTTLASLCTTLTTLLSDQRLIIPSLQALGLVAVGIGEAADVIPESSSLQRGIADAVVGLVHAGGIGGGAGGGSGVKSGGDAGAGNASQVVKHSAAPLKEDVVFAAGETLALAFGGVGLPAADVLHTPFGWLAAWKAVQESEKAKHDDSKGMQRTSTSTPTTHGDGGDTHVDMVVNGGQGSVHHEDSVLQQDVLDVLVNTLTVDRKKEVGGCVLCRIYNHYRKSVGYKWC